MYSLSGGLEKIILQAFEQKALIQIGAKSGAWQGQIQAYESSIVVLKCAVDRFNTKTFYIPIQQIEFLAFDTK